MAGARFQPLRFLGRGGMAEVYLGVALGEAGFRKPVVIKRVLPELAHDTRVVAMFADEARLAQHLSHQNVVQVYHVGKSAQGLYHAMEFVNGWNLDTVLEAAQRQRQPMPPEVAAFVVSQVQAGLAHAYRRTHEGKPVVIAHRDVSPANVLVSVEGEVKLSDFGIARGSEVRSLTEPGTFKGKLAYAAPEALRGEPVDAQADQFSLGVLFHELLTLRHPFWSGDNLARYLAQVERGYRPLTDFSLPSALELILARMLAPDPRERFAPAELSAALAAFVAGCTPPVTSDSLVALLRRLELPPPPLPPERGVDALPRVPEAGVPPLEVPPAETPALGPSSAQAWLEQMGGPQDEAWLGDRPALGADGRVEGKRPSAKPAPPPAVAPAPPPPPELEVVPLTASIISGAAARQTHEPALELVERHRPDHDDSNVVFGESAPRRPVRWGRWATLLLVLAAIAAGAWFRGPLLSQLRGLTGAKAEPAVLLVSSDPPGAKVLIDRKEIGTTPLAIANQWGGRVRLVISSPGYWPYQATFEGGVPAHVDAKLKKR